MVDIDLLLENPIFIPFLLLRNKLQYTHTIEAANPLRSDHYWLK